MALLLNKYKFQVWIFLLFLYLGLSNIYWLPLTSSISFIKYGLFGLIFAMLLLNLKAIKLYLPKGNYSLFGMVVVLILFTPSILNSREEEPFMIYFDFVSSYLFLWIGYILANNNTQAIIKIIRYSTILLLSFCFVHIEESNFGLFGIQPPLESGSYDNFQDTGFNLSRTGWSNGISLFVPMIFFVFRNRFFVFLGLIIILYSQFLSGGRTGLLTSIIAILLLFRLRANIGDFGFILAVLSAFAYYNIDLIISSLRIERILGNEINFSTLNSFSANRLAGYQYGFEVWLDNPLFGKGQGNVDISSIAFVKDIHNFWIKTLAESGIFTFFFLISFVIYPIYKAWRYLRKYDDDILLYSLLVLVAGFVQTFFEPNVIFGSFQNSAIWWFALALALSRIQKILEPTDV